MDDRGAYIEAGPQVGDNRKMKQVDGIEEQWPTGPMESWDPKKVQHLISRSPPHRPSPFPAYLSSSFPSSLTSSLSSHLALLLSSLSRYARALDAWWGTVAEETFNLSEEFKYVGWPGNYGKAAGGSAAGSAVGATGASAGDGGGAGMGVGGGVGAGVEGGVAGVNLWRRVKKYRHFVAFMAVVAAVNGLFSLLLIDCLLSGACIPLFHDCHAHPLSHAAAALVTYDLSNINHTRHAASLRSLHQPHSTGFHHSAHSSSRQTLLQQQQDGRQSEEGYQERQGGEEEEGLEDGPDMPVQNDGNKDGNGGNGGNDGSYGIDDENSGSKDGASRLHRSSAGVWFDREALESALAGDLGGQAIHAASDLSKVNLGLMHQCSAAEDGGAGAGAGGDAHGEDSSMSITGGSGTGGDRSSSSSNSEVADVDSIAEALYEKIGGFLSGDEMAFYAASSASQGKQVFRSSALSPPPALPLAVVLPSAGRQSEFADLADALKLGAARTLQAQAQIELNGDVKRLKTFFKEMRKRTGRFHHVTVLASDGQGGGIKEGERKTGRDGEREGDADGDGNEEDEGERDAGMANAEGVAELVRAMMPKLTVDVVMLSNRSFIEQVAIMKRTALLIAMHGPSLANTLFLPPNATLLELFPPHLHSPHHSSLAVASRVHYYSWHNAHPLNTTYTTDCMARGQYALLPEALCAGKPECLACVRDRSVTAVHLGELRGVLRRIQQPLRSFFLADSVKHRHRRRGILYG
ncbi:unnamed protein product [Closterium sp. Yama58-4]|nr:unnamed protein product [Closterium sp. Yama58-4]